MAGTVSGLLRRRGDGMDIAPHPRVPGFYSLKAGNVTGRLPDPFFGLEDATEPPPGDLARLFQPLDEGAVPVASFSDYNCPYCRAVSRLLQSEASSGGIDITWHELPLLGPGSVEGARAALAARLQGRYLAMHTRLMSSRFQPNAAYLREISSELGLDADRLLSDMYGASVQNALAESAGLAQLFGIHGTPALVVGRVLVLGNLRQSDLRALVAREAQSPARG
ncbi:protein-disulfide isomerase [Aliiruegeria haliotis]|uniref:Protein-disulfide isomerase n=2 Tax=Aliiruegeria haliotis TaxID=1280846 RepID=A0A2T0RJ90_9RHOB|nr:protein-disulfide isomerase [Aliiruegeria haliotis]